MATLTEKVRSIAWEETPDGHEWVHDHKMARPETRALSDDEAMACEWGFLIGLAYGIAREEEPSEPNDAAAARAREAADAVFMDDVYQSLNLVRRLEAGKVAS